AIVGTVALTDDQGGTYTLRVEDIQHDPDRSRESAPVSLRLGVNPVPARELGWLELRGRGGAVTRLMASADPQVRVSRQALPDGPAARELSQRALELIGLRFGGAGPEEMERLCSAALTRAAEIRRSEGPGVAGDLPGQLARLCAALTGDGPADGLP